MSMSDRFFFFPNCARRLLAGLCSTFALLAVAAGMDASDRPSSSLDGSWEFRFAPDDRGTREHWFSAGAVYDRTLEVPGCWDAQGVGEPTDKMRHNAIGTGWYRRAFTIPRDWAGKRVWLVVGGVHRTAKVWVNAQFLGEHVGYPVAFRFDITDKLKAGQQSLVIAVESRQDKSRDPLWGTFDLIDYMDISWGGIYEHVRLEATGEGWIGDAFVQPDPLAHRAELELSLCGVTDNASISYSVCSTAGQPILVQGAIKPSGQQARLPLDLPKAPLWTPEHPSLLTLDLKLTRDGQTLDLRRIRFGLRKLEVRNGHFSLNGAPFFLRGYGDDFNFPRELIPPASVDFWKRYLQKRKDFGFNGVRHHSAMPMESYLQAADEIGMLVQPELPIAYLSHWTRSTPEGQELYKRVWRDYIRQMRNHPSVMSWCMDNEVWRGIPIRADLYKMAKELDPTRLVIDCDGIPAGLFGMPLEFLRTRLETNGSTLDYCSASFHENELPWGSWLGKYRVVKDVTKPVIAHEMANYCCLPDPAEAKGFDGVIKPFWLEQMNQAVKNQGLEGLLPQMLKASWKLQASQLKLNTEAARLALDGYSQWTFRDYWTTSDGIESILGNTRALTQPMALQFNSDAVLLWDRKQANFRAGEKIPLSLVLSDFRPADAPRISKITVRLGEATAQLNAPPGLGGRGAVGPWTGEILAPEVRSPKRLALAAEAGVVRNEWPVWVWPPAPAPGNHVLVTPMLTQAVLKELAAGASVLVTDERVAFPAQNAIFKLAGWKGDEKREFVHGNLFLEHPALTGFPHDGYGDLQAYELLNHRPVANLDKMPGHIRPIVWAIDVPWKMRRMAYLWEARVGRGKLLVSAFSLGKRQREISPAVAWMHALLTRYASSSDFQPKAELPIEWLRDRVSASDLPEPADCVEGFHAVVASIAEYIPGQTYREDYVRSYVVRQTDGTQHITWKTAQVPAHWSKKSVTFVWAGGIDSRSPSEGGTFALAMNAHRLCDIPFVTKSAEWQGELDSKLSYQVCRATAEGTLGLFCLTIPTAHLVPGHAIELTITGPAKGSRRWISVSPYRDVAKTLRDN